MAFVRAIVLGYERRGRKPDQALARAGISLKQLRKADARIDADQMERLSSHAMQELDDEALGWFSRRLPWGTYGMLCRASLGAPSLEVALKRWCRHHALLTQDLTLHLHVEKHEARLTLAEHVELGPLREFALLSSLRYVHGYACWLVDSRLSLSEVTFPFAAPEHARAYRYLFPGPVSFGRDAASLRFDARYLALTPRRDEAAMDKMLQNALPLTVRQYRRDRLLVERVRGALQRGATNAGQLARALHVSIRSLHRQLQQEGASLQSLKDEVRRRQSIDLLTRTSVPIKELARKVGFRNEKSFARAFRAWTGQSPSAVRRSG